MVKKFILFVLLISMSSLLFGCTAEDSNTSVAKVESDNIVEEKVEIKEDIVKKDYIIPVLLYHNLESPLTGYRTTNITPDLFKEHMLGLKERGYNTILVSDYYKYINGEFNMPENPIMITFDDGYLSNYEDAYPVLKELGMCATIFIVTSTVGEEPSGGKVNTPHFNWEQAIEMQNSGVIDIQSHSYSHKNMSLISESVLNDELSFSLRDLNEHIPKEVSIFAYPYGGYNENTLNRVIEVGYDMQVLVTNVESGKEFLSINSANGLDKFSRLTISGDMSVQDLYDLIDESIFNLEIKEN